MTAPDLDSVIAEQEAEIARLTEALATSRSEVAAAHVEGERLAKDLALVQSQADSRWTDLMACRDQIEKDYATRLRLTEERDAARSQLRRKNTDSLAAVFNLLGDAQDLPVSTEEYAAIFDTYLTAEEPTPVPLPASCLVDGKPDPIRLFRFAEDLRREYREQPVRFWLRAEQAATPADPKVAAWEKDPIGECPAGSHGAPAVEGAVMVRRVSS